MGCRRLLRFKEGVSGEFCTGIRGQSPVTQKDCTEEIRQRQGPATALIPWETVLLDIKALLSASQ